MHENSDIVAKKIYIKKTCGVMPASHNFGAAGAAT
jgi:hypothetical protein